MPELIPVLSKEDIHEMVSDVAQRISCDYQNSEPVLLGVLKGAFIFLSDLVRHLTIPVKVDFIRLASYGSGTVSSGKIKLLSKIELDLKNKDVLVVEDIVDSGLTSAYLVDHLKSFGPKTVRICAFLDKYERRQTDIKIDYACHVIREGFLVGYGLDYAENYRNLPAIYNLKL